MLEQVALALAAADTTIKSAGSLRDLIKSWGKPGDRELALKDQVIDLLDQAVATKQTVFALQDTIFTLQTEKARLQEANLELSSENADLRKFQIERDQYELKSIGANAFCYVEKNITGGDAPCYCAACFDKAERSILQFEKRDYGRDTLRCFRCDARVLRENDVKQNIAFGRTVTRSRYLD